MLSTEHLNFWNMHGGLVAITSEPHGYKDFGGSKQFKNLEAMQGLKVDESKFVYGLLTLHSWIGFFECLLHIGYKLKRGKWQARGENEKSELKLS